MLMLMSLLLYVKYLHLIAIVWSAQSVIKIIIIIII